MTNINDNGSGSLRAACQASGPRIVVFRVGGLIQLQSSLEIRNPFITIAGQTAPGDGIMIRAPQSGSRAIRIQSHDVVLRYLRVRGGDQVVVAWWGGWRAGAGGNTSSARRAVRRCHNGPVDCGWRMARLPCS